jgi:UDP-glucose 4-epimerase
MKCLVTGATGFIGSELRQQLAQRGVEVAETGRESPSDEQLSGCSVLFHAAGIAHRAALPADYEAFNHRATLALAARACAASVRRFVFLSSVSAGPDAGPYGYWKWRTEEDLTSAYRDSPMEVILVRPALVYGPGAKANLKLLIDAVRLGLPAPPAGRPRSMIALPDLCEALCLMLYTDPGSGRVFFATDGEHYDLQRMHRAFCAALGPAPLVLALGVLWAGCPAPQAGGYDVSAVVRR